LAYFNACPAPDATCLTEDHVWRYHIALNKFDGKVTATWITRSNGQQRLWLDGKIVETEATEPDFPFFAFSQPPIGHVATSEPPFAVFGYKCRQTGHIYLRRMTGGELEPEVRLDVGPVIGGVSFSISGETVLARIDRLKNPDLVPALVTSTDSGRTFGEVRELDVSEFGEGFSPVPGFTEPVMDVGGHLHAPIHASNGTESVALNFVVREDALVEAIRIDGSSRISNSRLENLALSQASQEVFPATLGNPNAFGNGITDGHGLIMVLSAEGRLFSSNSSAGGMFYPEKALLNYEMPLVHTFASTECYTSGMLPNYVSMDYVYIEADAVGQPISSDLHFETWDMPLPIPEVVATARESRVNVRAIADADMEPGQVTFSFSDPSIRIVDVRVTSLRTAEIETDAQHLEGKTLRLDVDSLFHRHYAEAVIQAG